MIRTSNQFSNVSNALPELTALAETLIRIPSFFDESNDEAGLTEFLYSLLTERLPQMRAIKQFIDGSERRYNLILKGSGYPKLLVIGHVDTVHPGDGWQTNP